MGAPRRTCGYLHAVTCMRLPACCYLHAVTCMLLRATVRRGYRCTLRDHADLCDRSLQNYALKLLPQPQVVFAFGLRITNCAPCKLSV